MEPIRLLFIFIIFVVVPHIDAAVPGTFFWRPRLGFDLSIPTTENQFDVAYPNKKNVQDGVVVLVDGYSAAMTFVAVAAGAADSRPYPHLNPLRSFFYTSAYRWTLRHISMMPFWLGGNSGTYCDTHKMWKRRFFYMDEIMPEWLRKVFFYVKEEDWNKEIKDLRRYKKFSEYAFAKHYRYPSKKFNKFKSLETEETRELLDSQSSSFLSSQSFIG